MATTNGNSYLPILSAELMAFMDWTEPVMRSVTWRASKNLIRGDKGLTISTISSPEQAQDNLSLLKLLSEISGDSAILTTEANKVASSIRDGMCIGLHVAKQYGKRAGLDVLQQQNAAGKLSTAQQAEFNNKNTVMSAIALFVTASYVCHELESFETDKIAGIKVDFAGVPELVYRSPQNALMCALYHFARYCTQQSGLVNNSLELVKLALQYFTAVANEVHDKRSSFQYSEPFTEVSYKLENSDFIVKGFESTAKNAAVSIEFRKVGFGDIVGNRRAKHYAQRLAMMICCYDLERKRNPFLELGSFPGTRMGFGFPGTGKSLQIAATATKIQELCDKLGIPFLFWPMPATVVSTFQGGSAERMEDWMRRLADDDKIVYGPIDDAEANFMDRSREGVSAGVKEVISVFLRNTEGASAIQRGNSVIEIFTNLPEVIDPAVLSRVQSRFSIDGAETREDFLDQDFMWHRKLDKLDPKFVGMDRPKDYEFLSAQKALRNLAELQSGAGETYVVKDSKIAEAVERATKGWKKTDHDFFGHLYTYVRESYPRFSSRDVRNIQSAIDARIFDFDLPSEWLDDVKLFYTQPYDRKVEMLKEALRANMKGLDFASIRFEETLRYLDTLAQIANVQFERDVTATVGRISVSVEADKRYKKAHS